MRDPNRVNRHGDNISARPDGERDLKCGTGKKALDGYSVLARRPRSGFSDEMVSVKVADDYESPMPDWYYD